MQLHKNEAVLDDVNTYLKLEPDGQASAQARIIKTQMEKALGTYARTTTAMIAAMACYYW